MSLDSLPRLLSAPQYVRALHRGDDWIAVLVRNRIRRCTIQRIVPSQTIASEPFQSWLTGENLGGSDIFIGMNPVRTNSKYRRKEHILEIRHLYLDLDEDAGAALQLIRSSGDIPDPNFVLDTSPGKHQAVWRVEGFGPVQAERVLRGLALNYGGDPAATDVCRLLRLPGFKNHKYNDAFIVRVHQETDLIHRPADFHVQEDASDSWRRPEQARRRLPTGHHSQSEADWAYARRALTRGDHPELVIERIADFRAEDKADPLYYARLTVIKAQLSIMPPASRHSTRPELLRTNNRDH